MGFTLLISCSVRTYIIYGLFILEIQGGDNFPLDKSPRKVV